MVCWRSLHRFSIIFKSGDCGGHSKTIVHLSWRYLMVNFEVFFGSLSWISQPLFNFKVWTDLYWTLASSWYLVEQWASCSSLQRLHPFFSKHTFFAGGQKVKFGFCKSKAHCSKRLQASQCFLLHTSDSFVLRSFFLVTPPCMSLLCRVCCNVVLRTARPVSATLFFSSFAVMCGVFWAFLTRSRTSPSEIVLGLPDHAMTSTIPFIFHFLIMFLTVEIGSLKHQEFLVAFSFLVDGEGY